MFPDSCTSEYVVPTFSYPRSVSPETIEEITVSKFPVHGDLVQQQLVGANAHTGVAGVQTLHHLVCELQLPTFSEVVSRWKTPPTI